MRWKIGLHLYWWRPAKCKKNNSWRVEKDEKISGGVIVEGRPSRLASCDFAQREACVWHARDDIVLGLRVAPSIYHYRHNQRLLLPKYWPGHNICNSTLEINLKRTPVMIETRNILFSSCFTSTVKDYISCWINQISFLFFLFCKSIKKTVRGGLSILSNEKFTSDTYSLLLSPTASHSFWWRSLSQTSAWNTSVRSMSVEWLTY